MQYAKTRNIFNQLNSQRLIDKTHEKLSSSQPIFILCDSYIYPQCGANNS